MKTCTIVIAATGNPVLAQAVDSALSQDYPGCQVWVVIDGPEFEQPVRAITDSRACDRLRVWQLPENTGANGFYGHRIYAASSFLINTDYVCYLDQDNWMDPNHVTSLVASIEANGWQWAHSLRKIHDKAGTYLCTDDCESLGKWPIFLSQDQYLVDTSCYCIKRDVITNIGGAWHWGWGGDRRFLSVITQYFKQWGTSGEYTLNYRLDGNPNSVNQEFFDNGNRIMAQRYGTDFPWRKTKK